MPAVNTIARTEKDRLDVDDLIKVEPRLIHDLIKEAAASYVLHETGKRPMVLPVVTEV